MAKITNALSRYGVVGVEEDISAVISNISPYDTPFMTSIGSRKVHNTIYQWQNDTLPSAQNVPQLDGFEDSRGSLSPTTMLSNVTQIIKRNATVSKTVLAVRSYGRANEMDYQMAKQAKALKTDMELVLLSTSPRVDGDDTTPRQTRGAEHWIPVPTGSNVAAPGTSYVGPSSATASITDGTQRTLSAVMLNAAMQFVWEAGGDADHLLITANQKSRLSGLQPTNSAIRVEVPVNKLVVGAVTVIETDFGMLTVRLSRQLRTRTGIIYNPEYFETASLRPPEAVLQPISGDAVSKLLTAEFGLVVKNPNAGVKLADLTV